MEHPLPDWLIAQIRTWWPLAMGQLAAVIVVWFGRELGITLDSAATYAVVAAIVTGLVYVAGSWLERRSTPWLAWLGRLIVGLGLDAKPTYMRASEPDPYAVRPIPPRRAAG